MSKPIASIIIPVSNNEDTLLRCVLSCQKQSLLNIEIILIVNNSQDSSLKICEQIAIDDPRVTVVNSTLTGRSRARNVGIRMARGKFINFLDADDTLNPMKLAKSVHYLTSHPEYFAYANAVKYVDVLGRYLSTKQNMANDQSELFYRNLFPINAVTFKNNQVIPFDEKIEYDEDWLFWVNNLTGKSIHFSPEIGGTVYITGKNTMANKQVMLEYFVLIRSIISCQYPVSFIRSRRSNTALLFRYFALGHRNPLVEAIVMKNMPEYRIVKLMYQLPCVSRYWKNKLRLEWQSQLY